MNSMKWLLLVMVLSSCAPIYVTYDYDQQTNFNAYKTYNYYSDMKPGLSDLDTRRLLDALDAKLKLMGMELSNTPDFFIDIRSQAYQQAPNQTVGLGVGGGGRNMGGGISIGLPIGQGQVNRQITIDFVDENKKQLFWQAISDYRFDPNASPETRLTRIQQLVNKVLSKYPPSK
ncbi:DUF4136 domain-containing protein [Gaetbulibacter sp. M240]|uniref:DUF4136 domain-containing protein n=1 Tax=Gaetbulibacter sp. M240 TaxID=3126511 RepID=UPI00374E2188